MTEKKFTVKEMQTWNKRYRLDKKDTTKVIDTTMKDAEFWTVHGNEAYNLCIELNKLYTENQKLKEIIKTILYEAKKDNQNNKRFTIIKNTGTDEHQLNNLYDNKTFIGSINIGAEIICYLLNTLHKENQQLKQELWETKKDYIIETADISDKPYLQEILKQEYNEIYKKTQTKKI